jgi:hypothetical protein
LVVAVLVGFLLPVSGARADELVLTQDSVTKALKDKGLGKLKDKAKNALKGWVFDTGQSETMHGILQQAEKATGDLLSETNKCRAVVKAKAGQILSDINLKWSVKTVGKFAFETVTKLGGLAAGGAGAAVEGGLVGWLGKEYAGAAYDKLIEFLNKEQLPQYEIYETSGSDGTCDWTLGAYWDIVHGTYKVLVSGDCHCKEIGGKSVESMKLGTWWISFEGKVLTKIDKEAKTISWLPQPPTNVDYDAQCYCNKKTLREPFAPRTPTGTPTAQTEQPGGAQPPKPPPAQKGRKVCKDCQPIQDEIDATFIKLDDVKSEFDIARNQAAQAGEPGKKAKEETERLGREELALKKKLDELAAKLAKCLKDHKCDEQTSVPQELRSVQPGYPVEFIPPQPAEYVAEPAWTGWWGGVYIVDSFSNVTTTERFAATDDITHRFTDCCSGVGGGLNGGWQWQLPNGVVLGGAVDGYFPNDTVSHNFAGGKFLRSTVDFTATFQARAGIAAAPNLLLYGQTGLALGAQTLKVNLAAPTSSTGDTTAGYALGAGAEWRPWNGPLGVIGQYPSVFLEYSHIWWSDAHFNTPASSPAFNYGFSRDSNILKGGLRVRF